VLKKMMEFYRSTSCYRSRFGTIPGLRIGLALRSDYKLPPGTAFKVDVPSLAYPVYLRAGTVDYTVFMQLLLRDELAFELPSPPTRIVDAGGNIGLAAIYLANRYQGAEVISLEVEQSNYELLQKNTAPYTQIKPRFQGLWSHRAQLRISNPSADKHAFAVEEARNNEPGSGLEAIDMLSLMAELGWDEVDLLKLDVEGAEVDILSTSGPWLGRVGALAVELHDRIRPGCSDALQRALDGRTHQAQQVGEYLLVLFRMHEES
jgi:FkbM family methyltransferase